MTDELMTKRKNDQLRSADSISIGQHPEECPRLLVSVRSLTEAECAISAGVDILDVKEPSLGSLGMANIDDIKAITSAAQYVSRKIPLSVALGEISDWSESSRFLELPHGITYAKIGLSGCAADPHWRSEWMRVRVGFQHRSLSRLRWVAVAYADANGAKSPSIRDVLAAAIEADCAGLLVDTFTKNGRRLNDEIDQHSLIELADTCHK
ncbi:MAG: (5-formylfuran-3-yl)methyl phosphate synthase, partial [Schlesneria sp.]